MAIPGVKQVAERLPGYRCLGTYRDHTVLALRFDYHGWQLWLPRKAVIYVRSEKRYYAPFWAIGTAKEHGSARSSD